LSVFRDSRFRTHLSSWAYVSLTWSVFFAFSRPCAGQKIVSPNELHAIEIVQEPFPGADPVTGDSTLILFKRGRAILKAPTTGYIINALWSSDGKHVAVNNRRGNSGDYLWVFSLARGRAVKKPDDESFPFPRRQVTKVCLDCDEASFDKDLSFANVWKSANQLQVESRWRYYRTALIVRHAVYRVSGTRMVLIHQKLVRHPVDWAAPPP
jgi:hypothetical protein